MKLQPLQLIQPKFFVWALIGICGLILLIRYPFHWDPSNTRAPTDFSVYITALKRTTVGQNPYISSEFSSYKYAPGILALLYLLPSHPAQAWFVFSCLSILLFSFSLLFGARYRYWSHFGLLLLGFILSWKGILETLDYGQLELIIFSIAVISASIYRSTPLFSGFLVGTLPWLKLPWILFSIPFWIATASEYSKKKLRQFSTGYLISCFFWGAAVPSLLFGPDQAKSLSQAWVTLLRNQPTSLFFSPINQSLWISAIRWTHLLALPEKGISLGLAATIAGLLLGRWMLRPVRVFSQTSPLEWVSPWILITQLLNPLAWRWGSAYLVGIPLLVKMKKKSFQTLTLGSVVIFLWLLQQSPFLKQLRLNHWTDLHPYGTVTLYWLAVLGLVW